MSSTSRKKQPAPEAGPTPDLDASQLDTGQLDTHLRALAAQYAADALATLADIMRTGESESTRVAAARALLDRGFSKAAPSGDAAGALDLANTMDRVIAEMREREERGRGSR